MTPSTQVRFATCLVVVLTAGCAGKKDFVKFMENEIIFLGGKTNSLARSSRLEGGWTVTRDKFGAAINTEGIRFETITNLLTTAYGEPQFYTAANERHGPTYVYLPANAGISIFVSSTKAGAEVTLTKPLEMFP